MSLDSLYQQVILEHSKERHGSGFMSAGNDSAVNGGAGNDSAVNGGAGNDSAVNAGSQGAGEGARRGESHQLNPICGDEVTVRVEVQEGEIRSLRWEGSGCSISMASASVLHDLAEGLGAEEFHTLVDAFREMLRSRGTVAGDPELLGDAAAFEGVSRYVARVKCAMIAWVAAEDAARQAGA